MKYLLIIMSFFSIIKDVESQTVYKTSCSINRIYDPTDHSRIFKQTVDSTQYFFYVNKKSGEIELKVGKMHIGWFRPVQILTKETLQCDYESTGGVIMPTMFSIKSNGKNKSIEVDFVNNGQLEIYPVFEVVIDGVPYRKSN